MWDKNNFTTELMNSYFKFSEKILQNLFEESNMKILNVKASLQKKNSSISLIGKRKLGILRKSTA